MAKNLRTSIKQSIKASSKASLTGGNVFGTSPLDLRFALQKTLDPRITFTRASSGTYVGSDGLIQTATTNEARFDHNPTTGESLGLLVEEARTNLLLRSEELDNTGSWSRTSVSVDPNVAVAPDGTTTADKLIAANGIAVGSTRLAQTITKAAAATTYTLSVFAKTGDVGTGSVQLVVVDSVSTSNNAGATFSTTLGTITVAAAPNGLFSAASATITPFANGWYRCTLTFTTSTELSIQARLTSRLPSPGDGTSGIYIWGAQLEAGAFPTSYIPTTTATVTRAADVASITGSAFTSFYNQAGGTVFQSFAPFSFGGSATNQTSVAFTDGTSSNLIGLTGGGGASTREHLFMRVRASASDVVGTTFSPLILNLPDNTLANCSFAFAADNYGGSCNGGTPVQVSSGALPSGINTMSIMFGFSALNGHVRRLTYWPVRLANPTIQAITMP